MVTQVLTATVMPPEMVERMKPEYVVPAVVYMASKDCQDSGMIIEAGAGNFNRAALLKGPGVRPGLEGFKDAEWVQGNWDAITSLENAQVMWDNRKTYPAFKAERAAQG